MIQKGDDLLRSEMGAEKPGNMRRWCVRAARQGSWGSGRSPRPTAVVRCGPRRLTGAAKVPHDEVQFWVGKRTNQWCPWYDDHVLLRFMLRNLMFLILTIITTHHSNLWKFLSFVFFWMLDVVHGGWSWCVQDVDAGFMELAFLEARKVGWCVWLGWRLELLFERGW